MSETISFDSPVGIIRLTEEAGAITELEFEGDGVKQAAQNGAETKSQVLCEARRQLEEYFAGKRREFTFLMAPKGTPFRESVWRALCDIPYGETRSYKELATAVGNPQAARAVGGANNKNPIAIAIPCHRVIGAGGDLVGYGGGLAIKKYLLELEKRNI